MCLLGESIITLANSLLTGYNVSKYTHAVFWVEKVVPTGMEPVEIASCDFGTN